MSLPGDFVFRFNEKFFITARGKIFVEILSVASPKTKMTNGMFESSARIFSVSSCFSISAKIFSSLPIGAVRTSS
ncbi:MAG: hypothetical protein IJR52_09490 [Selenomonadaceae bacterium]|nr:hypothetical protein [Selenomonadaceae bacterium]